MLSFQWNEVEALVLAKEGCALCLGLGIRVVRGKGRGAEEARPCACVLRRIFRACYGKFRFCASAECQVRGVNLDRVGSGPKAVTVWGLKNQEYVADFCRVSERALTEEEYRIFRFHFLLGADWRLCCRRLGIDRGSFFHELYRIEQKLGRVYRELRPYALYPLDEYFGSFRRDADAAANPAMRRQRREARAPLRPPLKAA